MARKRYSVWIAGATLLVLLAGLTGCAGPRLRGASGGMGDTGAVPPAEPQLEFAEEEAASAPGLGGGEAFAPSSDADVATSGTVAQGQIERLIIRTGNISLQADDTLAAEVAIEQMVAGMAADGAFVVSREHYGGEADQQPYVNITIRVPVARFDEAMDRIEGLASEGTTPSRTETGQDVTAEYVDLEARLQSLEAARDRLLEIMRNAQTTEELLLAEQQLTQREAEIESIKGQMKYLGESARLSSVSIQLQPYFAAQPVDTRWRPGETVRRAIDELVDGARGFADFLIFFSIAILPWLVLFGLAVYGIVRFVLWRIRVGREKRAQRAAAASTTQ